MPRLSQVTHLVKTQRFGRQACFFEHTDSTNSQAMALARQGAREGTLVLAERQDAGRGRLGRKWESAPGKALLFTLILRPDLPASAASHATLLFAVAVAKALRRVAGSPAEIKWPNDVLLAGRKVCGILVEMQGQVDRVDFLCAGVGLNVNQLEGDLPADLKGRATSLAMEKGGEPLDRALVLCAVLEEAELLWDAYLSQGFAPVLAAWQGLSCMGGRQVKATLPGGRVLEGMSAGLDPDGALLLRLDNGVVERLVAGDVTLA